MIYRDHFQNYKSYNIPKAQLIIADIWLNSEKQIKKDIFEFGFAKSKMEKTQPTLCT